MPLTCLLRTYIPSQACQVGVTYTHTHAHTHLRSYLQSVLKGEKKTSEDCHPKGNKMQSAAYSEPLQ